MSAIRLFLLGFLLEKSMSPYDLAKFIGKDDIQELIKVSRPSIYKNFKKMKKEGYLDSKKIKEGEMPVKTIYSITEKGRAYFRNLMENYASEDIKYHYDFNSMLINLNKVSLQEGIKLIDTFYNKLISKDQLIDKYIEKYSFIPLEARMIIKQHKMLNKTLIDWLEEFKKEYILKNIEDKDREKINDIKINKTKEEIADD